MTTEVAQASNDRSHQDPASDFEPNQLPLGAGVVLLEASAGTGKTFTLAHLVLRLVAERGLPLRELLVVTFTEVAAAELKDRIGRRLEQALQGLEPSEASGRPSCDGVLREWLEQWAGADPGSEQAIKRLRARLLLALEDLDAADITTIHGFCHRTLRRHALEAGLGPELELESDANRLIEQTCHDYWQQQILPLPAQWLEGLKRQGLGLSQLRQRLSTLEDNRALALPALPPGFVADQPLGDQLTAYWSGLWSRFCEQWQERGDRLYAALKEAPVHWKSLGARSDKTYPAKPRNDRHQAVSAWLNAQGIAGSHAQDGGSYAALVAGDNPLKTYFHPGPFTKAATPWEGPEVSLPERPLMEAVAALVDGPAEAAQLHFAHWAMRELRQRRQRNGRMGFGDLLTALDPGPEGQEHGELIAAIGRRYQVGLIDEFQDTDPLQWRILRQAFSCPDRHLLVMVGDPKQAIYGFRGGDLGTYQAVRHSTERVVALRQNFRSSSALVGALNLLMEPGLVRSGLSMPTVVAQRSGGIQLTLPQGDSPLQLLWLGEGSRGELERGLPEQVGALVLTLLQRGIEVREGDQRRDLLPEDICLLVSRHAQAEALRQALELRGIASRLVSKADLFQSEGAAVLQRLLDVLAEPGSERRRRLLAASPLLGWSAETIAQAPARVWASLAERLARLSTIATNRGLLAALGELISPEVMAGIVLSGRLLADLQQGAELVQERMHQERLSAAAAADWLRRRRHHPPLSPPQNHQPNSAAVQSAVAVVTMHRSKGLEFPVVICPYLWQAPTSGSRRSSNNAWPHRNPHWGPGLAAQTAADQARGEEAERLAYVAATRAMELLILCYGPAKDQEANPLEPWLFDQRAQGNTDRLTPQPLCALHGHPALQLIKAENEAHQGKSWQPPAQIGSPATGPIPERPLVSGWGRSSYSSWTHGASSAQGDATGLAPPNLEEGRDTDAITSAESPTGEESAPADGWSALGPLAFFPRGASAGDCLHRILERVDHQLPAADPGNSQQVELELQRAGIGAEHHEAVLSFLDQLRLTPMGGALGGFQLSQLPVGRRINEMNFDLPLARGPGQLVRAAGLARVFRDHPSSGGEGYADQLANLEVASRGFLTGSMDLIFTAPDPGGQERWWVADWKSNWLGVRDGAGQPLACGPQHYGQAAMEGLMVANHYLLQGHLYLVALDRYLRWRQPGYQAERHLGGTVYVFLRGVPGPQATMAAQSIPGMLVETVDLARLAALDTLLCEGQP
ncbi:MAG: UvrD-helicase domain-containing protein [Cyanobacteria bacterium]|nr:UvrD-helicase domain-containing protein [Cyanobacteria bacterium bin.51]